MNIKKILGMIKQTPMLVVFLIIAFVYMPVAITLESETERNAIVTAVGIDKADNGYEVSFLCFVPQANADYSEKYEVITCLAKTISENLEKASIVLGKNVNMNHVEAILLSDDVLKDDVSHALDFFARAPVVLSGCNVAGTNGKAKDVIEIISKLNGQTSLKVEEILRFSEQNYYGLETTLDTFYQGYYSPTNTSVLSYIEVTENEKNGISSSENKSAQESSSTQGQSSGGGESNSKSLSNLGELVVLKNGKKQSVLNLAEIRALNYANTNYDKALITLEDIYFKEDLKVDVVYEIIENKVARQVRFENNVPIISYNLRLKLDLYEVIDNLSTEKQTFDQYHIDLDTQGKIEKVIKQEFASLLRKLRESRIDLLKIYDILEQTNRGKFYDFLESLDDKEDFLSHVVFALSVESVAF